MEHIFESNSSANADQETSYQELSYPVGNDSFPNSNFAGNDHQESSMKNVFQMNQSLPSPPPTPMGLKNIADVLDPSKYSSQMNSNFLNYQHHMNGSLPSFSMVPRYGYDSDHMTAAAAVAAAQSQHYYPQESSMNNMSMESLITPEMRNYQDMMRGVPMMNSGKMMSDSISDEKVYKCQKPNCSKVCI